MMLASGNTLPSSRHPLVKQQSDTARQALSRQESGSSRGVPDPSASLDAIHPADRSSSHASGEQIERVWLHISYFCRFRCGARDSVRFRYPDRSRLTEQSGKTDLTMTC